VSLINNMLQDLEARRGRDSASGERVTMGLKASRFERQARRQRWLILSFYLVLLVGVGAFAWYQWADSFFPEWVSPKATPAVPIPKASEPLTPIASAPQGPAPAVTPLPASKKPEVRAPSPALSTAPAPALKPRAETKPPAKNIEKPSVAATAAVNEEAFDAESGTVDKRVRTPSREEQAQAQYQEGARLMSQGRTGEAEAALSAALKTLPSHQRARELLAGLLLQNGRREEARKILNEGLSQEPLHAPFVLWLARLSLDDKREHEALALLQTHQPRAPNNPEYLGFLAALYQRQNDHASAVQSYRAALAAKPREGRWWIGLGLSLEAQGQTEDARQAYQKAMASGSLDQKLSTYVEGRLNALKQ
jgi:MSHA biogenesis protein MshN